MTKARDIADGVDTADIADGAISAAKIADGAITDAKISGMASSKLTGALPAVDGSALTGLSGGLKIAAVTEFNNSGTWTPTANTNYVEIAAVGAGGGSGGYNYRLMGGGGGGGVIRFAANIDYFGASETVTIGSAGNSSSNGNAGGTTTFGNHFTLNGGAGGINSGNGNSISSPASGGNATTNVTQGANVPYIQSGSGGVGWAYNSTNGEPSLTGGDLENVGVYSFGGKGLRGYNTLGGYTFNSGNELQGSGNTATDNKINLFAKDSLVRRAGSSTGYIKYSANPNTSTFFQPTISANGYSSFPEKGIVQITEYEDL
jgi:hypothetical protein